MLTIQVNLRVQNKKSATRLLRNKNQCPANIYSKNNEPNLSITLKQQHISHPDIATKLYKNNIIMLSIENKQPITVKIQEIQYHPFKPKITHIDFICIK